MTIQEDIPLAGFTTFKIGGNARYFCLAKNENDLKEGIAFAKEKKISVFVLGGGSNILISEKGFDGLVIKVELVGVAFEEEAGDVVATVASGENWDTFVAETVKRGLYGLENLSGIPGSVGGAPVQNIGAYGMEVKDAIQSVEVFDPKDLKIKTFSKKQCQFGYRDSIFKHEAKNLIIMRVVFLLKKKGDLKLDYRDVKKYLDDNKIEMPTLAQVRDAILEIRSKKFPDLKKFGTAGSFFKNPIISKEEHRKLLEDFPKIQSFPVDEHSVKIPAGWLLDVLCGFKGVRKEMQECLKIRRLFW